jgi:hypothetical protein
MSRPIPIRATSAHHYAAADNLRTLAASALLRGEYRLAAQQYAESKTLRREGDELRGVEEALADVGKRRAQ